MFITKIYDEQSKYNFSPEFNQKLIDIKPDVDAMITADKEFKHRRMVVIGQLVEFRNITVNLEDKNAIRQMLGTWTQDVIDNASAAYKTYKELKGNVNPEFQRLADAANPSQLMTIGRGTDTTIAYDAAMALKRDGKVPSVQTLRGHLGGYTNNKFENKHRNITGKQEQVNTPAPEPVKTQYQEQLERQQAMVESNDKPLIRTTEAAGVYMAGGRKAILAAAAQVLYDYKYKDESLVKIIEIINELSSQAQTKPSYTAPRLSEVK